MSKRMYIVVNEKLTKSQRIPQASHAVAEYVFNHKDDNLADWINNDRTMVVLQSSEGNLAQLSSKYRSQSFRDSDLQDMLTAVAFEPMTSKQGEADFRHMRLA